MAGLPTTMEPTGPDQQGRGKKGQYVYWVTMAHPTDQTVQHFNLQVPDAYTRPQFSDLVVAAHTKHNIDVVETAVFKELHE